MTNKELIEKLQQHDPDLRVIIEEYCDFNVIEEVVRMKATETSPEHDELVLLINIE